VKACERTARMKIGMTADPVIILNVIEVWEEKWPGLYRCALDSINVLSDYRKRKHWLTNASKKQETDQRNVRDACNNITEALKICPDNVQMRQWKKDYCRDMP
jgi:hypothetical protein